MRTKHLLMAAVFLLAGTASSFAQELTISPSGSVSVGTVLHFHLGATYGVADCQDTGQTSVISWYVMCLNGTNWKTEKITPPYYEGWQHFDFTATYTVTAADIGNPSFCFVLVASSFCWSFDKPYNDSKICPNKIPRIPPIKLQKYFDCSRIPGCPNCLMLDLKQLIQSIGNPQEQVQVVLLRGSNRIALLGEAGRGRSLPAQFKITLPAADQGMLQLRQAGGFQLQVLGASGQVLASQEVTLKIR